jgi:hypothetical protein
MSRSNSSHPAFLVPIAVVALLVGLPATGLGAAERTTGGVSDVYVSDVVVPRVLDVDLRDLPPAPAWQPGDPIEVVAEGSFADLGVEGDPEWVDPVRQTEGAGFDGGILVDFEGIPFTGAFPPDVIGDVGPNHYIGMVNASRFAIWDKEGNVLVPVTTLNTLWDANGGDPGSFCNDGDGDPIVQYDELADRWLMTEFDLSGNTFCIYVSQGPDPVTSGWFVYDFSAPDFPDYPKYGVWPDAYYVSTFESPGLLGNYAFDRTAMLAGAPATFQAFTIPHLDGSSPRVTRILPSDHDGTIAPSPGLPNTFARTVHATQDDSDPTTRIELWEFHVDFAVPANSTFTQIQTLIPAPFDLLPCSPGVRDCVPQPGTANLIDALFNRAMRRLQWRSTGSEARMVVTQVVDAGGGLAGKRWWELRSSTCAVEGCLEEGGEGGASWSIHQEGTYAPDGVERFMGSIAQNANGEIALGYTVSDEFATLPGMRVTARREGDPLGTMTMSELTLEDGEGVQTISQRWGDYSSMNVDPADGETFWYTNQIVQAGGLWRTHIGAFRLDLMFADGFESGDTSAWSQTVP